MSKNSPYPRPRFRRVAALAMVAGALLAACGDDDDEPSGSDTTEASDETTTTEAGGSDTTEGGDADEGLERARAVVEQYRSEDQPIGVTIPLTEVPEPHTIAWLECELESCRW